MKSILLNFSLQKGIIVCRAVLFHENKLSIARRVGVDTCASYTFIHPEIIDNLGIDYFNVDKVETAGITGEIQLPKVIIQQIGVKDANAKDVEVLVGQLPKKLALDGLLGYSFLKHFKITIDYKKEELTLISN